MSKLLGIVNPQVEPSDYFHFWLWRATAIPWEYEQLTIEKMDVECGNVQFRVIGPHTHAYPDGVFLKLQINADLKPEIRITGQVEAPWIDTPLNTLLASPNPPADEPPPVIPSDTMVNPPPSQKDQLVAQISQMLETLKALS